MKILAVCTGNAEKLPGKSYKTGINKHPVSGAVMIDENGLIGDAVCNRKHHGGPCQAVYVEGSLTLDWWARELGQPVPPGLFGENVVIDGLDNTSVAVGDRFVAGDLVLEVTSPRIPCATFAAKMGDPKFVKRYMNAGLPGIYCRVLKPASLSSGTGVEYRPFEGERVTMPEMMKTFGRKLSPKDRERYLSTPLHKQFREKIEAQA
ncbi:MULTISPECIES: MOSC domain-containing protein [unclassified Rhizobium]|uniref:MOSC domain-containing protein n=1 Tax=unclassified Rhizobium TaxID=2613769 RepID=UPI001ADB4743|nr:MULTISPECIES: MOSC domain-containing protein [unclassified Rhizobium]MBO9096623.1 MOSC domain-containing protein [Rhizobium sp. L58/93]MBO9136381.1 MOSC domain-containing protein [Rhizobium sp. B209b/85]MBO9166879.1 MOSC domain-containing protein [Rhizobium sp. L245/93]MBO9182851.1 MOSC domain-containing protein [Rhizobium sp. E27B/91]QXZ82667.1 MOSC domain-containing protein [Rhizobium sp. K1/93]